MKRLAILGASGHGKVVADLAELAGWQEVVFFDDAWPERSTNGVWPVIGSSEDLLSRLSEFNGVVIAIGNNSIRLEKLKIFQENGAVLPTIIHPHTSISRYAKIGEGSVIRSGVVVDVDAHVGAGAILNTGCSIGHDCRLADGIHVSPGARLAGTVTVGEGTWIGMGAVVRQLLTIGAHAMVGSGAAVVKDVPDHAVVMGVPAK